MKECLPRARPAEKLIVRSVNIVFNEGSGRAKNSHGMKSLSKNIYQCFEASVDWEYGDGRTLTEKIKCHFASHGQMRDVFVGTSEVKEHVVFKFEDLASEDVDGEVVLVKNSSNCKEMQLLESGFSKFAVEVYWSGECVFSGRRFHVMLEAMVQTVDHALRDAIGGDVPKSEIALRLGNVLAILSLVLDLVFRMNEHGYSIFDAGPHNLGMVGLNEVRMLDWEHIEKTKQSRKKIQM